MALHALPRVFNWKYLTSRDIISVTKIYYRDNLYLIPIIKHWSRAIFMNDAILIHSCKRNVILSFARSIISRNNRYSIWRISFRIILARSSNAETKFRNAPCQFLASAANLNFWENSMWKSVHSVLIWSRAAISNMSLEMSHPKNMHIYSSKFIHFLKLN